MLIPASTRFLLHGLCDAVRLCVQRKSLSLVGRRSSRVASRREAAANLQGDSILQLGVSARVEGMCGKKVCSMACCSQRVESTGVIVGCPTL